MRDLLWGVGYDDDVRVYGVRDGRFFFFVFRAHCLS